MFIIVVILGLAALTQARDTKLMVGYNNTNIFDHPYQVAIEELFMGQTCGGALIARNLVLTAAYCLGKLPEFYAVRAGSTGREYGGFRVHVQKYVNHPKYQIGESGKDYGISVIKLTDGFALGLRIQIIQLTSKNSIYPDDYPANFTGWERQLGKIYAASVLQFVTLNQIPQIKCAHNYENIGKTVTNRMMCYGLSVRNTDTGVCKGNGGGPLVNSNRLIGIALWFSCFREKYVGVFVDIRNPEIYEFIQNSLANFGDIDSNQTNINASSK